MQIENDYDKEVYNGDIGYVVDVDPEDGELTASFDGRSVTYGFGGSRGSARKTAGSSWYSTTGIFPSSGPSASPLHFAARTAPKKLGFKAI
jgi:hypothetical protein